MDIDPNGVDRVFERLFDNEFDREFDRELDSEFDRTLSDRMLSDREAPSVSTFRSEIAATDRTLDAIGGFSLIAK